MRFNCKELGLCLSKIVERSARDVRSEALDTSVEILYQAGSVEERDEQAAARLSVQQPQSDAPGNGKS